MTIIGDERPGSAEFGLVARLAPRLGQRLLFPVEHRGEREHALDPSGAERADRDAEGADAEHDRSEEGVSEGEGAAGEERAA